MAYALVHRACQSKKYYRMISMHAHTHTEDTVHAKAKKVLYYDIDAHTEELCAY